MRKRMNRFLFVLMVLSFLLSGCSAKKVWVMTEATTYDANDTVIERKVLDEGSTAKERHYTSYDGNGDVIGIFNEEYDENNNLIVSQRYDSEGNSQGRQEYTYHSNNMSSTYKAFYGNNTLSSEVIFDINGNILSTISYDEKGVVLYHSEFSYDDYGNEISWISYNDDGSISSHYEYEYGPNGEKIRDTAYDKNGTLHYSTEYSYDENGYVVREECISVFSSGSPIEWFYEYKNNYDSGNRITKQTKYDDEGNIESWTVYTYPDETDAYEMTTFNNNGIKEETHIFDKDGEETGLVYYDDKGNWEYGRIYEYDSNGNQIVFRNSEMYTMYSYKQME